jgi:tetratricopeptide (TPR) repeat protein
VSVYIGLYSYVKAEQGEFKSVYSSLEKLSKIADSYEYEIARTHQLVTETHSLYQCRKLYDAQKSVEKWVLSYIKIGSDPGQLICLGYRALIQILVKDHAGAEESLTQAEECHRKQAVLPPIYAAPYLNAKFFLNIELLEESIRSNNKSTISKHKTNAYKSGKNVLRNSKKCAPLRSEALRLVGLYYWLIDTQNKAVKWWKRAIEEGEQFGARPDLARTYMEVGKRFLEEKSSYKELNGIGAEEYLEKARTMFHEMDLQWDLDELDKIAAYK